MRAMIGTLSLFIIFMRLVGRRPRRWRAGVCRTPRQLFINSLDFVHVSGSTITSKDKDGNFHEIRKITARFNSQTYTMPYYETADRIESAIRCQHGQNWGPAWAPNNLYSASTATETVPKHLGLKDGNCMNASRVQRALCAQQAILPRLSRLPPPCLYCRLCRPRHSCSSLVSCYCFISLPRKLTGSFGHVRVSTGRSSQE